jgi:hypothetical protein
MAHNDALEEKWRENWRMEWVAFTQPQNMVYSALLPTVKADAHTSAASSWQNCAPVSLNGLVCFAERWNLVSAHVPSHFNWLLLGTYLHLPGEVDIFQTMCACFVCEAKIVMFLCYITYINHHRLYQLLLRYSFSIWYLFCPFIIHMTSD